VLLGDGELDQGHALLPEAGHFPSVESAGRAAADAEGLGRLAEGGAPALQLQHPVRQRAAVGLARLVGLPVVAFGHGVILVVGSGGQN
jgi:hypothetical protein